MNNTTIISPLTTPNTANKDKKLDITSSTTELPTLTNATDILASLNINSTTTSLSLTSTTTDTKSTTHTAQLPTQIPPSQVQAPATRRLVVFDSTDPEFDEDSDPDNDLDL